MPDRAEFDFTKADLNTILSSLGAPDWDIVLFGDGSGSTWERGGGWASVVCFREGGRKLLYAAANCCSVTVAELMAVAYGMLWCSLNTPKTFGRRLNVHVISDSEITVRTGRGDYKPGDSTKALWAMVKTASLSFNVRYHWMRRETTMLNQVCDIMSRESRLAVEGIKVDNICPEQMLFVCNPNVGGAPCPESK